MNDIKSETLQSESKETIRNPLNINYFKKQSIRLYLRAGDTISIVVSRDYPELTTNYIIDIDGKINIRKLKNLCRKFERKRLENLLNEAYKEFVLLMLKSM